MSHLASPGRLTQHTLSLNILNHMPVREFLPSFLPKGGNLNPQVKKKILIQGHRCTQTDQRAPSKFPSLPLFRKVLFYLRITEFEETLISGMES